MRPFIHAILRHPRTVIAAWVVVLAIAAPFAPRLAGALRGSTDAVKGSPSELVSRDLNRAFGDGSAFVFPAVIVSPSMSAGDPRFATAVAAFTRAMDSAGMRQVRHFWNTGDAWLLGRDGRSALVLVTPKAGTFFDAESAVERIRAAAHNAGLGNEFEVNLTGMISMFHDLDVNSSTDLLDAERVGIPLTLIVLLVVFAAPIAAGLPLLLALCATAVTLAFLYFLSAAMPVSVFAENAVTMIGLGVGVDYALFLVSRCRQEIAAGAPFALAVETAAVEAGHAVLVSGLSVCIGFLALFLVNIGFLHTLALGGVMVVATSVCMTLTLLPAVLSLIGERVLNWPRKPVHRAAKGSLWARWAHEAMSRPWRYLVPALIILAALILPARRLTAWNMGAHELSPTMEARKGYEALDRAFTPGWMGPIALLIETRSGTVWTPEREQAITAVQARFAADPRISIAAGFPSLLAALGPAREQIHARAQLPSQMQTPASGLVSEDGRTALVVLVPRTTPESAEAMHLVRTLRSESWDELRAAGLDIRIGGFGAGIIDFDEELFGSLKRVVPLVLCLTFVVLAFVFRSLVIPLKAIAMNLLSVLASYGFLVLLFQDGIGAGAIGLVAPGGLNSFIVLMLFTILFGLSMDYEVFLLSRIREEYRKTGDNRDAVAHGLASTGGLITSAALIMVVLFGSFGFTRLTATREFGLGLAFAVALDATLIRVVLVPILMGLMGRANWWLPRFMRPRSAQPAAQMYLRTPA